VSERAADRSGTERVHRLLGSHKGPDLLYGAIVTGSVLAVASAHAESGSFVALAAFVVTAIYWLAHVYVDAVGDRFRDREHSIHARVVAAMRDTVDVLFGSLPPIAVFVIARLLGADVTNAAWIALWLTVALLIVAGAGSAYLAGVRGWALVVESLVAGCFGMLVILLKFLLH
jgi:hypothetical protein